MTSKNIVLLIWILLSLNSFILAQHDGWQNYTDSRNVTGIVSDASYWWLSTTGGLVRIHQETGIKTVFNHANSPLPSNNLSCIDIDPNSNLTLWIGTNEGIAVYDRQQSWTIFDMDNAPLPSNQITCLDYSATNEVLIGTNSGLILRSGGNWEIYNDLVISAVYMSDTGEKYFGSGGSIAQYYNQQWVSLNMDGWNVSGIDEDNFGRIWVSDWGEGIFMWDGFFWTKYDKTNAPFPEDWFSCVGIDDENNLWTGCGNFGLWSLSSNGIWWSLDPSNSGMPFEYINKVYAIESNYLAVGSNLGFCIVDNRTKEILFTEYDITNSPLEDNHIRSVYTDTDQSNDNYIGGIGLLYKFSGNSSNNQHIFTESPFGLGFPIDDILVDHLNRIWVGTKNGAGIAMRGNDEWTIFDYYNSDIHDPNVNCLLWEPTSAVTGNLWIGGDNNGLGMYDGSTFFHYDEATYGVRTAPSDMVMDDDGNLWLVGWALEEFDGTITTNYFNDIGQFTVCIEREGNILWIGAYPYLGRTGGLVKYDGTDFTTYHTGNSDLPGDYINDIAIDSDGTKYVACAGVGLAVFNDLNDIIVYTRENSGLPENQITDLDIDADGNVWIGTDSEGLAILGNVNIIGIEEELTSSPKEYKLYQNYPNPFNPSTTIQYSIKERADVELKVYDILGREVVELVNEHKSRGTYKVEFIADQLSSGIYIYQLFVKSSNDIIRQSGKMLLLK